MEQFAQNGAVMLQLVRNKQWFANAARRQIFQELAGIVQFAPTNMKRYQQTCGGIDSRPYPCLGMLTEF
jgi:hypothetical protein